MAESTFRATALAVRDLARFDRALRQQPGDNMHDARGDLEGFARESDSSEWLERRAVLTPGVVEIRAGFVGQQHRLGVKRVDQARRDPHLRAGEVRFVHSIESATVHRTRKRPKSPGDEEWGALSPFGTTAFRR